MTSPGWNYFIFLENEFIKTIDFAELSEINSNTYSNNYAKLILLIGSEVDVISKLLCRNVNSTSKSNNIHEYQREICGAFPGFETIELIVRRYKSVKPWSTWGGSAPTSPLWWKAYNDVKHDRLSNFENANQHNVLTALCGLLSLHLYMFRGEYPPSPYPSLLAYDFPVFLTRPKAAKPLPGT